jgi:hypothetical protein
MAYTAMRHMHMALYHFKEVQDESKEIKMLDVCIK